MNNNVEKFKDRQQSNQLLYQNFSFYLTSIFCFYPLYSTFLSFPYHYYSYFLFFLFIFFLFFQSTLEPIFTYSDFSTSHKVKGKHPYTYLFNQFPIQFNSSKFQGQVYHGFLGLRLVISFKNSHRCLSMKTLYLLVCELIF